MTDPKKRLFFDEETHTYTVGDRILPSVTEICSPITASKYAAPSAVVDYAASRGSRVHELCAMYDFDALPDEIEAECLPYVQAWAAFCRDWRPTWELVEWSAYSAVDGYAGTADRIGLIDGARCVVDIKTAASLDRASKVALTAQLAGYRRLAQENGLRMDGADFGVQLRKDGSYTVHSSQKIAERYRFDPAELFGSLLELNRIVKGEKYV